MLLKQLDSTMAKYFGPKLPSTSWLEKRAALALINSNPILDNSGPLLENVISIGGMHIKDAKPLPKVDLLIIEFISRLKKNYVDS